MIRVSCDGTALTLQGHAGTAPYGQDLVCAAVTGLVYALAQRLTELDAQGAFEKPPEVKLESGDARIRVIPKEPYAAEVLADFQLIYSGLRLLQNHYPEQVTVERYDTPDLIEMD